MCLIEKIKISLRKKNTKFDHGLVVGGEEGSGGGIGAGG
jgi:hypothetical protein